MSIIIKSQVYWIKNEELASIFKINLLSLIFFFIVQIVGIFNHASQARRTEVKETKKKSTHLEFNVGLWVRAYKKKVDAHFVLVKCCFTKKYLQN